MMLEGYAVSMKKVHSKDLKSGRLIGKGSSSVVYETTLAEKRYARKDFLRVPSDVFEKEAAALVGLDHLNVVRTFCWAVDDGSCSLVVELMDDDLLNLMQTRMDSQRENSQSSGSATERSHVIDLHKFLEVRKSVTGDTASESVTMPFFKPFTMLEALQIMLQVSEGVKYLHDEGVAHGDLKPKNILVSSNETVSSSSLDEDLAFKVADFGLYGTKMKSRTLVSRRARNMEVARWRAPELLELAGLREDKHESSTDSDWDSESSDEKIGELTQKFTFKDMARADIYSFAITCSQILTGEDPYPELSLNDLVREILSGLRPGLPPTCPARLRSLLERCWGEKTKRPSFEHIFSELIDLQASLTTTDTVVNYKSSMTESSSSQIDTFELELVPESSAVSGQPGGGPESSSAWEIHQTVHVPIEDEEYPIKDMQADSSEGIYALLKQQRIGGKAFGLLRKARSSLMRKMMSNVSIEKKEKKGISSPTNFSAYELNRRPPELYVLHVFSSSDIKRMTNNFNEENILRREGLTTVYKGIQPETGAIVAVMRLRKGSKGDFEVVKREITMMTRVHHNNVMGLVGFCCEKKKNVLVYEYLPNGTLRDWLHGSKSDSPLDWDRRLGIALCAARGLAHLHTIDPPIIHRYINSHNILLDQKLLAKVKLQFGLSLLVPYDNDGSLKPTIDETMGYRNPKDDIMNDERSDVYSFGVLLLELLTGRPPNDNDLRYSVREVRKRFETAGVPGVQELLDRALAADIAEEELEEFLKIALVCVEDDSRERPSMAEVVNQLEALVQSILLQYSIDLQLVWFSVNIVSFKRFLKKSWED